MKPTDKRRASIDAMESKPVIMIDDKVLDTTTSVSKPKKNSIL